MLPLRAVVEERPPQQNGHFIATCEEVGSGVFGSASPPAAVAIVVSNPCHVPPASACPMSPLATPSNSNESASASSLGTDVFSSAVTLQSPIRVRSDRRRIASTVTNRVKWGAFCEASRARRADERIRTGELCIANLGSRFQFSQKLREVRDLQAAWVRERAGDQADRVASNQR